MSSVTETILSLKHIPSKKLHRLPLALLVSFLPLPFLQKSYFSHSVLCGVFFFFLSYLKQGLNASMLVSKYLRVTLNFWSSCLYLPAFGSCGTGDGTRTLYPRQALCQLSYIPAPPLQSALNLLLGNTIASSPRIPRRGKGFCT